MMSWAGQIHSSLCLEAAKDSMKFISLSLSVFLLFSFSLGYENVLFLNSSRTARKQKYESCPDGKTLCKTGKMQEVEKLMKRYIGTFLYCVPYDHDVL